MGLKLPEPFIERIKNELGGEAQKFLDKLMTNPPISIRRNPLRISTNELPIDTVIPWESDSFYLTERPSFTYDPSFHAGAYYVQEASSMITGQLIDQIQDKQNLELVIDLCAAPGGKTTHALSKLNKDVFVLANEVTSVRLGALRQNVIKWGHSNAAVINYPVDTIANTGIQADLLLIDAPCSGEGLFRKDHDAVDHWNAENLRKCEIRQTDILSHAATLVKMGGYLIYSTCTYNSGENIKQLADLIKSGYFEIEKINHEKSWGLTEIIEGEAIGYQCYPHKVRGEGFFIALLKRTDKLSENTNSNYFKPKSAFHALSKEEASLLPEFLTGYQDEIQIDKESNMFYAPHALQSQQQFMNIRPLFELGAIKGRDFIPAHGISMLDEFKRLYPKLELNKDQAIKYLKKDTFTIENYEQKGWHYATYHGNNIGLVKILENRINNYLPVNLRILK
mgnify:FL=1